MNGERKALVFDANVMLIRKRRADFLSHPPDCIRRDLRHGCISCRIAPLKTSSKAGTDPQPIADFLSRQPGLKAEYVRGARLEQLEQAVDRGEPAIVNIQAWQAVPRAKDLKAWATDWIDGHYVVLIGYDRGNFYFMDPSTQGHYTYVPRGQLSDRWHDVVGDQNVHTQHIVIFVRSTLPRPRPARPTQPSKTKVTIIN